MEKNNKKLSFFDKLIRKLESTNNQKYIEDRNNLIGALLKRKREEQRLTQSEVSEDICSISYLSKIESNKVPINENYSAMLMERLDINKKDIILLENAEEYLNDALEYYYSDNKEAYLKLFNDVSDAKESIAALIIQFGFYLLIDDKYNYETTFSKASLSLKSIDNYVLKIFTIFANEYLFKNGEFDTALKTLKVLERDNNLTYRMRIAIMDLLFRAYAKENRILLASKYYNDLEIEYIKNINLKRVYDMNTAYLFMLLENGEYDEIISEEYKIKNFRRYSDASAINYVFGYAYYKKKNNVKAIYYFDRIKEESIYYAKSIMMHYELTNAKETLFRKVLELNDKEPNFYYLYFINKEGKTITQELFKTEEYNKAIALASIKERISLYLLEVESYYSISRYKEAILVERKINKLISF